MSRRKSTEHDQDTIDIIGASANNLRDVDVHFPLRAATLVVGVSGSG
jgi:excinuclease UvrABC ATPase subunit